MQRIVIDKPYVPVPPYRGTLWPMMLVRIAPWLANRKFGITQITVNGAEHLRQSLAHGDGIMLAPNHSRDCDPFVLAPLSREVGKPFFVMASWHVFEQSKWQGFLLHRAGAFSVYREGMDRQAMNTAIEILTTAERPLVIFPEGVVSRSNDRLNALMDGAALIARTAAKRREKDGQKKVVVHPVAIRYHFHGDIHAAVSPVLDEIEQRLTWRKPAASNLYERLLHVGSALLALKEIEYLGQPQSGTIAERITALINRILQPIESEWTRGNGQGSVVARVKNIRTAILPDLIGNEIDEKERARRWDQLADAYLAQQLANYPPDYVSEDSNADRILETVERFEEDLTDHARVHRPMSATVTVGEAIPVSPNRERGSADPLIGQIESQLRALLKIE